MRDDLVRVVAGLPRTDALGEEHRTRALAWLRSTDDVYRRERPRTPDPHLVAYVLVVDRARRSVLLADHRLAGLWLPTGGHVEPEEDPATTAVRELREELGVDLPPDPVTGGAPWFLTVTTTTGGAATRHDDVSLWYAFAADRGTPFVPDEREFRAARWWTLAELGEADPAAFEPHLARAVAALGL
jgi:8-oxo-dGTP pyrophosphatase MutT (NUDIX family)